MELRTSLLVVNKAVFPLRASQFDLWTLAKLNSHVSDARLINEKLNAFVMINQASFNPAVRESSHAEGFLEDFDELTLLKTVIAERIAFRKAATAGKSVKELLPEDKKASHEIVSLYQEIFNV